MARKTMRFRWIFAIHLVAGVVSLVAVRLLWFGARALWSDDHAVSLVLAAALAVVAVALGVRRVHRSGETVRGALLRRRQLSRALVDSAGKLHTRAPVAAGFFALASFPAVFLALVAARRAEGVQLPPAADARLQLWCIAAGVVIAFIALDCWYGPGISLRALVTDGFTSAAVTFTVALAAASPLMIFHHVESRAAGLVMSVAQFAWPFAGLILCGVVSGRRKRKLFRFTETAPDPSANWLGEPGIDATTT